MESSRKGRKRSGAYATWLGEVGLEGPFPFPLAEAAEGSSDLREEAADGGRLRVRRFCATAAVAPEFMAVPSKVGESSKKGLAYGLGVAKGGRRRGGGGGGGECWRRGAVAASCWAPSLWESFSHSIPLMLHYCVKSSCDLLTFFL